MSDERIDELSSEDVDTLVEMVIAREAEIAELREDPYAWYESAQRVNAELREERDEYKRRYEDNHTARALVAEYEGDVIPTLRERAENAESMNVSVSVCANHTTEIVSDEVGCWVCEAQEANERAERAEKLAEALETISEAYAPSNHPEEVARAALAAYRKSQIADTSPQVTTDPDTKTGADLCQVLVEFIERDHDYGCECSACRAIAEHTKVASDATILQEKDTRFACNAETVLTECAVKLEALGGYGYIADMLWAAAYAYTQEET